MSYTTEPHPEIDGGIALEDAAKAAGLAPDSFAVTMSRLNKSGRDLRSPARPGERARRYDAEKLAAWISEGKPVPARRQAPAPGAKTVQGTAAHENGVWTARLESGDTVKAKTITALRSAAQEKVAEKLALTTDQVDVQLTITAPQGVAEQWQEAADELAHAEALMQASKAKRLALVASLKVTFTNDDIAAMLGLSPQRVHQLSKSAAQ